MQQINIPFKTDFGWSDVTGIVKFSGSGIALEFEKKFLGIFKGDVREYNLSLTDILDVKFRKGFFKRWAQVEIRLNSLALLRELPNKEGKIVLKLQQREDFARAKDAVADLQKNLSELPPKHAPVSRLFEDDETSKD